MSPETTFGQGITVVKPDGYSPNGIPVVSESFVKALRAGHYNEALREYRADGCSVSYLIPPSDRFMAEYGVDLEWSAFMRICDRTLSVYSFCADGQLPLLCRDDVPSYSDDEINKGIAVFRKFNPEFCEYVDSQLAVPFAIDSITSNGTTFKAEVEIPPSTHMALSMFGLMEAKAARDKAQK